MFNLFNAMFGLFGGGLGGGFFGGSGVQFAFMEPDMDDFEDEYDEDEDDRDDEEEQAYQHARRGSAGMPDAARWVKGVSLCPSAHLDEEWQLKGVSCCGL
eukprot:41916-Eustigmatos_ZCMA.PRE.1